MKNPRTFIEFDGVREIVSDEARKAFWAWGAKQKHDKLPCLCDLSDDGFTVDPHGLADEIEGLDPAKVPANVKTVIDAVMVCLNTHFEVKGMLSANAVMMVYEDSEDVQADAVSPAKFKALHKEDDNFGLRPEETEMPALRPDPNNMRFSDAQLKALEITGSEADAELARESSTPEEKRLLSAKKGKA